MVSKATDLKQLLPKHREELLGTLEARFNENRHRHPNVKWEHVQQKLTEFPVKLWSLNEMERTGGEPDVVFYKEEKDQIVFYDCSKESPKGRRSVCYDREALESRKKHKPDNSAMDLVTEMGVELLTEEQYRYLQTLDQVDLKTSSWVRTPADIRDRGGALFCDRRYGHVFLYHNGADSYYAARGFRASLTI